jgi:hypothetical protein
MGRGKNGKTKGNGRTLTGEEEKPKEEGEKKEDKR